MSDEQSWPTHERRSIPQDFVVQTAAVLASLETNMKHLIEGQRQQGQKLDGYVVEHRSHHLEDRQFQREMAVSLKREIEESVDDRVATMKEGRRVYLVILSGLLGTAAGAVLLKLIESAVGGR